MTRIDWFASVVPLLAIHVFEGYPLAPVRVTCKWPGHFAAYAKRIGGCWPREP